jgi:heme exporter protein D
MSIWTEFLQMMGFGLFIGICVAIVVKIFERQN